MRAIPMINRCQRKAHPKKETSQRRKLCIDLDDQSRHHDLMRRGIKNLNLNFFQRNTQTSKTWYTFLTSHCPCRKKEKLIFNSFIFSLTQVVQTSKMCFPFPQSTLTTLGKRLNKYFIFSNVMQGRRGRRYIFPT